MASFFLSPESDRYTVGRAFTYNGVQYSSQGATAETFKGLGFTEVQIQPRPDDAFYIVSGPDDTGAYNSTPRDHGQLVHSYIKQAADDCHAILAPTDWYVVRKIETGEEIPMDWELYRTGVRNTCAHRQQDILQTKNTAELEALIKAPAEIPVDPMDPDAGMKPNPDPHLEPWPRDPEELAAEQRRLKREADALKAASTKKPGRKA